MQLDSSPETQEAREHAALKHLGALKRQALPQNAEAWHASPCPLAREHIEGEPCRILGKVFSWSPLYFDVAILVGDRVVRRKVSKTSVHLAPCENCPIDSEHPVARD